jgi:hypothetical protein
MKTYTFSGTYRRSQEFDYEVTVTSEDISRKKAWGWPPEYIASHPHLRGMRAVGGRNRSNE